MRRGFLLDKPELEKEAAAKPQSAPVHLGPDGFNLITQAKLGFNQEDSLPKRMDFEVEGRFVMATSHPAPIARAEEVVVQEKPGFYSPDFHGDAVMVNPSKPAASTKIAQRGAEMRQAHERCPRVGESVASADAETTPTRLTRQTFGRVGRADAPPSQSAWAMYIDNDSLVRMLWGMGELFIRACNVTLKDLQSHNQRAEGGLMLLYLLGKQGNMARDQFYAVLAPERGKKPDYSVRPQPTDRVRTLYEISDLEAKLTPEVRKEAELGKYSRWWKGDVETLVVAIWCIGGLIAEPLGEELTPKQKEYVDTLEKVYHARGKDIDRPVVFRALESYLTM